MPEKEASFGLFRPDDGGGRRGDSPGQSPEAAYASARSRLEEQIARDPTDGEARLELGSLASFADDFKTAETHLRRAVELLPENPRAHLRLGDVLYETARLAEAVRHYREALRFSEGTAVAEEARVEFELAERELALVYRPLEETEAAAGAGLGAAGLNRLGCLYLAAGRIEEAAGAFGRALEADSPAGRTSRSSGPAPTHSLQAAINCGFIQRLATVEPSRLKRSVSELASAAERFPDEPRLYLHLAELYEASSLYDAAVGRIERALEVEPRCLEAYDMAARYVMLGGEYGDKFGKKIDQIVAAAEDAVAEQPGAAPGGTEAKKTLALAYLGRARFRRNDREGLSRACGLLEELAEGDDDAAFCLAECRERAGMLREAEELLQEVAARSEGSARAAFELGGLRLRSGRPAEAVELFAEAVREAPGEAAYYQSLRYALAAARKLRTAELLSRAELTHDPRSASAHLDLGRAYLDALRIDDALEILEKATELAPDRADCHTALGKALARAKRPEDAESEFRRALGLDPDSAGAHRGLGNLLIERPGRMREGLAELEEYRRLASLRR